MEDHSCYQLRPPFPDKVNSDRLIAMLSRGQSYIPGSRRSRADERPPQNDKRTPSCTCRFGNAEVKASGVLEVAVRRPAAPCRPIPLTLKVVNPGVKPKSGLTSLFTLAKFVRFQC